MLTRKIAHLSRAMSRRRFLRAAAGPAGVALDAAACGGSTNSTASSTRSKWRQSEDASVNFISENTPPTAAITANIDAFTELAGIEVKIQQLILSGLVEKVALDFASGSDSYHVIYADPYQVLAPCHAGLADLRTFAHDPNLPSVPKGIGDFIPVQLDAAGRFGHSPQVLAFPYDAEAVKAVSFYNRLPVDSRSRKPLVGLDCPRRRLPGVLADRGAVDRPRHRHHRSAVPGVLLERLCVRRDLLRAGKPDAAHGGLHADNPERDRLRPGDRDRGNRGCSDDAGRPGSPALAGHRPDPGGHQR